MKTSVLYLSYTGLLEPLGQSQVLQYVTGLARDFRMTLLTFEKPQALQATAEVAALKERCRQAGVEWYYLKYHNRPNLPATAYDMFVGTLAAIRLARKADVSVVHCRSYLASLMGLMVKRATGARHLFDMRGFWPDERVDGGIWRRDSLQYKVFKRLERTLFLGTDHVVSLTHSGAHEIRQFEYLADQPPPVSVIPTCTNLDLFQPAANVREPGQAFTLGYVGSVGSWYLFDEVARLVKRLFEARTDSRFLVINKGSHALIQEELLRAGVDMRRVEIRSASFTQVAGEIATMDAGIFFYQPDWSKRATCPTRMGEFLAVGKPCLTNAGVGDVEQIFGDTGTGVVIDNWEPATLNRALAALVTLSAKPGIAQQCRAVAENHFSLPRGIDRYAAIYRALTDQQPRSSN